MARLFLFLALLLAGATSAGAESLALVVGKNRTAQVGAGDSLYQLALRHGLAIEHLAFANRLPVQLKVDKAQELLVPGRRVLPGDPPVNGLVVNLPERGVFLFLDGSFSKFYPIAIGQPGRFATPTGQFELISRVKDPTWLPPEWAGLGEKVVPAGPDNPLGDRWMGLSEPGLGLHSTTQPTSIGSAASHGCMRVHPTMVHELFDKVAIGFPVRIEYEPVKLGKDSETGSYSLAIFPDVYQRCPLAARAEQLLEKAGLKAWMEPALLQRWVEQAQGVSQVFAEGDIGLQVGGMPVGETGWLVKTNVGLFACMEAYRQMGISACYDPSSKTITLSKKELFQVYSVEETVQVEGKNYLPIRTVLTSLMLPFRWDNPNRTLIVDERGA